MLLLPLLLLLLSVLGKALASSRKGGNFTSEAAGRASFSAEVVAAFVSRSSISSSSSAPAATARGQRGRIHEDHPKVHAPVFVQSELHR